MNGIYSRDQLNLQPALADALNRRERQMQRQADRNTANTEAIQNLMKAGGRWYETSDPRTIDERIAELEKEKQLIQAAAQDKAARQAFDRLALSGKGLNRTPYDLRNDYVRNMQGYYSKPNMAGYQPYQPVPTANPTVDDYEQAMAEYYRRNR
jgi:hypothetical protein